MAIDEKIQQLDEHVARLVKEALRGLQDEVGRKVGEQVSQQVAEASDRLPGSLSVSGQIAPLVEEARSEARGGALGELVRSLAPIDRAKSQAEVLSQLLEQGADFASRIIIFLIREDRAVAWQSQGFGEAAEAVGELTLEYREDGPWQRMSQGKAAVGLTAGDCGRVCSKVDSPLPSRGVLVPLVLRDQVAAAIYADTLPGGSGLVPEALQILTYVSALAIETLPYRSREFTPTLHMQDDAGAGVATASAPPAAEPSVPEPPAPPPPAPPAEAETEPQPAEEAATEEAVVEEAAADEEDETLVGGPSPDRLAAVTADEEAPVEEAPIEEAPVEEVQPEEPEEESPSWPATAEEPAVASVEAIEQPALEEVEVEDTPEIAEEAPDGSLTWETAEAEDEAPPLEAVAEPEGGPSLAWEEEDAESEDEGLSDVAPMPPVSEVAGLQTVEFTPEATEEATEEASEAAPPEGDFDADGTVLLGRGEPAEAPSVDTSTSEIQQVEEEESAAEAERDGDDTHPGGPAAQAQDGDSMFRSPPAEVKANQVAPPEDIDGPGWAFSQAPKPSAADDELHEKARRLARLLVSEIKLYNEEQVEEGRRNKNIYERLKEDIDRSRQMYEDRVDERVRNTNDYFYQELVRTLAAGDSQALGI
ncbi:MAG: hypothetical protein SX243_03015 [Acidobacteriota bacterium]|nr:hypothetical protein [Acidobacteriota bacterium]